MAKSIQVNVKDIIDRLVRDREGDSAGRIRDLSLEARDGRLEYVELEVDSGATGNSSRTVRLPWSQFSVAPDTGVLTVKLSSASLRRLIGSEERS